MARNVTSTKEDKMLNRDFSKSNREYFKKNKFTIIILVAFLLIGTIVLACFGMNTNFELSGYNEFTVRVGEEASNYNEYIEKIQLAINSENGDYDSFSIMGEGDDTKLVIRYNRDLTSEEQSNINDIIAEDLSITIEDVSAHSYVSPVVENIDYIFTALTIILILILSSIFAYFRYNAASALTTIIASLIGSLMFISIGAILRLSIGMSYFAMLIIINLLIIFFAFNIFEHIREKNWLQTDEYSVAIDSSMKANRFRLCALNIGIFLIGLLLVILAPTSIKYIALNIMFLAVVVLAIELYVVPFSWSVFITLCKKREVKVKADKEKVVEESTSKKDIEQ